jgi:hypothetical protein
MGVIFDEVVGTVEPETSAAAADGGESETSAPAQDPAAFTADLRRRARRAARLRAD